MFIKPSYLFLKTAIALSLILSLIFLTGCSKEEDETDYSGVGKLISDRNKARQKRASSGTQEFDSDAAYPSENEASKETSKRNSSGLTFEENVRIVSERSGKTIAWATAYLDKGGRIVNIRIRKKR